MRKIRGARYNAEEGSMLMGVDGVGMSREWVWGIGRVWLRGGAVRGNEEEV